MTDALCIRVALQQPGGTQPLVAGTSLKGSVSITWNEELVKDASSAQITGLFVSVIGEEHVQSSPSVPPVIDRFLEETKSMLPSEIVLPPGDSRRFEFQFSLPAEICPASCSQKLENGQAVSITYTLSAVANIEADGVTPIQSERATFSVVEAFRSHLHPVSNESSSSKVQMNLETPQQAFAIGESIPMQIHLSGPHRGKVAHVTALLTRIITAKQECGGSSADIVVKQQVHRRVFALSSASDSDPVVDCQLDSSADLVTSVMGKLIQIQYEAEAVAHVASPIPAELRVSIPIQLLSPRALSPLVEPENNLMNASEFAVSSVEEQGPKHRRLIPDTTVHGKVFWRTPYIFFFDIQPNSTITQLLLRGQGSKKLAIHGRFGEEPSVFVPGIPATELSQGRYVWRVAAQQVLGDEVLPAGRWYFSIAGGSVMQNSDFKIQLHVGLKSSSAVSEDAVDVVFENQARTSPFGGYCIENLAKKECYNVGQAVPAWTTKDGASTTCKEDVSLPSKEWYWKDNWRMAVSPEFRAPDGWQYAVAWESDEWRPKSWLYARVRRRVWSRIRAIKPEGYVEPPFAEDLDDLLGEFEMISDGRARKQAAPKSPILDEEDAEEEGPFLDDQEPASVEEIAVEEIAVEDPEDQVVDEIDVEEIEFPMEEEDEPEELSVSPTLDDDIPAEFYHSDVLERQEQEELQRKQDEASQLEQFENDRKLKLSALALQREQEKQKMEEAYKQQQTLLREQLERDRARLHSLQQGASSESTVDSSEPEIEIEVVPETTEEVKQEPESAEAANATYQGGYFKPGGSSFLSEEIDFSDDDDGFEPVED